ncbi:MAG: GNAT family protein [Panacibacter sp.]
MELVTARLKLQMLSLSDLDDIHQLHSLTEIDKFNTSGIPDSINTTLLLLNEWLAQQNETPRRSFIFCIRLLETNKFIGLIALNLGKPHFKIAEVWYKIHPDYWRNGYATEALMQLLKFGFIDLALHRIEAGCAVENTASIKVLERVGMIREGSKRAVLPIRGEWVDNYFYAILETDFKEPK